ncbi:MAG TPA: BamA/TamA family outer membrane protein [Planctomycetota bacterium]|nr:BamA/TamA family outer membrane protein [Planctomycetota bacterium]
MRGSLAGALRAASGGTRRGAGGAAVLLLLTGCSVFEPSIRADRAGPSGKAPVEVVVAFKGNEGLGSTELRRRIEDYMFDLSRDPTRESAVYDAALELEDLYRTEGYAVAKVEYEYSPPAEDSAWPATVHVLFAVTEGPRIMVDLTLSGNAAFPTQQLLALWARRRAGAFALGGVIFVEAQVRALAEELRTFYRARGFLDAAVVGPQIDVDLARSSATASIEIQEGVEHTIGGVEIAEAIRSVLGADLPGPPVGKAYSRDALFGYRTALRNALRKKGYPKPRIDLDAAPIDGSPHSWRVEVTGEPGARATIAAVDVAGNDKTMDAVILGKLDVEPGESYDGTKIDSALLKLYRLGLFRKVEIHENPVDDDPSRLGLVIQVEENESRAIEFLAGYGSYEQLRGGLRLEDNNVFGTGRGVALDNRVSMKGYSTGLTVTDPDLFTTGATLTVSGEYFRREEPSFTDVAVGGTVAVARPLFDRVTARVGYTYLDRTDAEAFTAPAQAQLVDFVEGKVFFELRNDQRDNLMFPKSGHAEFVSYERIAPEFGASVDLDRVVYRMVAHVPLFDDVHVVLRTEQSALWPHQGSAAVPLQLRWFNGGESSVRSYRESQLGPKDVDGEPVGGEYSNVLSAELRLPLWRTLELGLFADAGNVGTSVQDFSLDNLGYAIGAGLRLLLPIGPVRVDAGWNPDQRPGDDEWVVHFSVGYPF